MSSPYLDSEPRKPIRTALVFIAAAYALFFLVAHLIYWTSGVAGNAQIATPSLEETSPFIDPKVLHYSPVTIKDIALNVPYQAGIYEITEALPAEFAIAYREKDGVREGRAAIFTHSLQERWKLLTPFPGSTLLSGAMSADDLVAVLRLSVRPTLGDRLLPWRLIGWTSRAQLRTQVMAEGNPGRLVRLWSIEVGEKRVVGREYEAVERSGRVVCATIFQKDRIADLRFAFNSADPNNMALAGAVVQGIDLAASKKPDNETELVACERLQNDMPDQTAIRVCRELCLVAQMLTTNDDLSVAFRLYEVYKQYNVEDGLKILHDRLELLRGENADVRRLIKEIETQFPHLFKEGLSFTETKPETTTEQEAENE